MQKSNPEGGIHPASTTGQTPVSVTQTVLTASQIQALSSIRGQQNAIGVLPVGSGASLPTVITLPRAITAASSVPQALHVSGTSLSNTRLISPQTINIIQRQVPASGIVGLSSVTAQGLQQVLQASGAPLTLVTASPDTAAVLDRERKLKLLQRQREQLLQTGSTVHHLGQKGVANPASNQNVSLIANMSSNAKQTSILPGGVTVSLISTHSTSITSPTVKDLKLSGSAQGHALVTSIPVGTTRVASSPAGGPPPKKIKVEEKTAVATETASLRQNVCGHKYQKMREIKARYREHLTELFYLQGGGNIVEFNAWKKRPTQPLLSFLEGSKLDNEDDAELQEKRINDEVKVLTSAGSNVPIATPVAISTTLPPSVSALSQQAMNSSTSTTSSLISSPLATVTSSELQQHLSRASDVKNSHTSKGGSSSSQPIATKSIKSQSTSPGRSRQAISAVYENVTGSQDVIERAKQEAKVLQRVNELRKEGLWTAKRLPRVQEPPRQKAHWDYLLEEMTWLAADFIQERKWKKAAAKKIARMVSNYFKEREMKELKAEKEEAIKLKKIASQMSKMVKEFWSNIEKVVHYKQTTRLEEKKKKALDLHLSFIVDQTEKYSSWLTAGLQNTSSKTSSVTAEEDVLDAADGEFQPMETASDDEETIEKEEIEAGDNEDATKKEIEALQKESELPLEEVLKGLPKEMLDEPSSQLSLDGDDDVEEPLKLSVKKKDFDYTASEEEDADEEETLDEQEQVEKKDYSNELNDLKEEGEMSVEELMKKYAGAYDSDFEMPEESSEEEESSDGESSDAESGKESEKSSEEMEEDNDDRDNGKDDTEDSKKAIGLEYLVEEDKKETPPESQGEHGPGKEFNDIAAAAQSLQPKGYTLETTEVKTKVPFLLKHTLREYQHVGLDWLATMHDKRLNGILADEMGLGKTIQTIALLAHLACEKGVWGPHLIVVPTSVMLNWEMEIKKWCPAFKILTYYGTIKERKLKRQGWTKTNAFHVCVTSYKLVVQDHQAFRRKKWKYFILDEAQNIKNFKSQRWQMLLNFSSQRRLLLTGTPLQNSLMELWSLMHFLMPNVFQSHSEFKEWFSNPLTGMIEGSKEYNESLVRRLHKVLRPFLLRRLKNEVEKQMPQKFEHVVMCRLSKRQRYLYDDFMSQTKTKETLAGGHFMSVINILMQLRKVCNHPNLFDPRPVVSPFKMEGIVYNTASLVARALDYDPFRDIDIYSLYPNLAEMETDLPAFVAQRVKQLHAPRKLIEEVDDVPPPEPRPPHGQLKNFKPSAAVAALQQADLSASSEPRSSGTASKPSSSVNSSQSSSVNSIKLLLPSSSSSSTPQSILIPNPSGSGPSIVLPLPASSSATSAASTVSSTSVALAQAKLISSQLQSGVLQLVQTSKGHQVITAASTSNSSSSSTPTNVSTSVSLLKVLPQQKPVMKVSPFVISSTNETNSSKVSALSDNKDGSNTVMLKASEVWPDKGQKPVQRSELFLESLYRKKEERRRHILSHLAKINQQRCSVCPVLGTDSHHCVNCFQELSSSNSISSSKKTQVHPKSLSHGYTNCLFAQNKTINHFHPDIFWRETSHLIKSVHSPDDHLKELESILCRFVFATPSVISPNIQMHISHPDCHSRSKMDWLESHLRPVIQEQSAPLHPIQSRTLVQFPEPRLIQYDCGKLQTLDLLLRQLKSGHHRVLIFTQMTKMLDVLEAFLNFHGHRYLRLDGTTKVEQRQYLMDRFNADPRIFCFILSTRSGGIGVNLTGADTVIFYDSDWNPTMDAQAQDRCHRIGQTRDVHIYRLVSEMTVEENILKKANQKRLLGDLAIEGGNFTTAFFKEQTINDLFAEPSGLECLLEEKETQEAAKSKKDKDVREKEAEPKKDSKKEPNILSQFEQALSKAEDETDAQAVKQVQAEQKAELAEFDETIPWDEREADLKKEEEEEEVSRVEIELAMLDKELTPIERYAVTVMEAQMEPETAEELKMAEEDIENSKKDWELARLKALKEEEERKAELEEDEMLYIYSKDESQVKRGRKAKTPKQRAPKPKKLNTTSPGSDADEGFTSPKGVNGRRASERLSPVKSPKAGDAKKAKKVTIVKKKVDTGKKAVKAKRRPKDEGAVKKMSKEAAVSGNRSQNGPKVKSKGKYVKASGESEGKKTPVVKSKPKGSVEGASEKREKPLVKTKTPVTLQNGHSPNLINSKLSTQARNALLKQQSQQASRIIIGKGSPLSPKSPIVATTANSMSPSVSSPLNSPPARLPLKLNTAKSPTIDPNVPPPWSNPNLVIRTRKAAVHSPVVLSRMQRPPISMVAVTTAIAAQPQAQCQPQPSAGTTPVLQQTLSRLPVTINTPQSTGVRLQSTPDRNIFQLFNTSGITITPTIRQLAAPAVGQLRTATLINPVSFVNTVNLSGARLITTGGVGLPSSVVVSPTKQPAMPNVAGNVSNITLVPTVINAGRGPTIISQGASAANIVNTGETRTVLNTARLASPITLQSLGGMPVAVNVIKPNTALTVPVRPQLLQTTSLAQVAGQSGYVLITPRPRLSVAPTGVTTVQAAPAAPTLQGTRLLLAQMPQTAVVQQQPVGTNSVNGVAAVASPAPTASLTVKKDV